MSGTAPAVPRPRRPWVALLVLAAAGAALFAAQDPPELTHWKQWGLEMPGPRGQTWLWLDVAALIAACGLAAWLVVRKRSRVPVAWLAGASLLYFGFYKGGCLCPIGAIQAVAQGLTDPGYAISLVAIAVFFIPLLFTLLWGRVFCGSVCPLGAIQDLVVIRPAQVPAWADHVLGLFAWVYLGLAVLLSATGAAWIICDYDPFVSLFRRSGSTNMVLLGLMFLGLGTVIGRPYCRFLCPYGAILRLLGRFSAWRLHIYPDACIKCRLCEEACPFGAINLATPEAGRKDVSRARRLLIAGLVAAPLVVGAGAWLGRGMAGTLARQHPDVRLADLVAVEGRITNVEAFTGSEEHRAFFKQGRRYEDLQASTQAIHRRFRIGGALLGAFLGLVLAGKFLALVLRRPRDEYEADPSFCLSCARCFAYCPGAGGQRP